MAELDTDSTPNERIVAVFPHQAVADRAAAEAKSRGARNVAINDPNDDVKALVGEMREETSESWAGPSIGPLTPEMARHIPGPTAAFALVGALLALPLALLDFGVGRVILCAFSGAVAGGLIGFLVGGFLGARRRANRDLAEERGVVVGIQGGNPSAAEALVEAGPMRIDRVVGQVPVDTMTSHEEASPSETTRHQPIPQDEP
ncbi:MAG: hypothetical protein ACRDYF_14755 [Acidimicrobiia bacterium]